VYGNLITVYSRTTSEDIVAKIATEGWKVGNYGDYGAAIYMAYNFESSDYADRTYGTHVMKFALKANNRLLIIGDKEAMKKAFGKELSIEEQLRMFAPESLKNKFIANWVEYTRASKVPSGGAMPIEELKKYINGILLYGGKDGHMAIIYKPEGVLTMLSWAKIPKDYKFKSDDDARKEKTYEYAMEEIEETIIEKYQLDSWETDLYTIEDITATILEQGGPYLSTLKDVAEYLGLDDLFDVDSSAPVYRDMDRTMGHEKDYSGVKYDKGSMSWKKEIGGVTLPQKVKLA